MSSAGARLSGQGAGVHPVVYSRRVKDRALLAASILIPIALGLLISIQVQKPSILLLLGGVAGVTAVVALMVSPRYEVTLTVVALYLGLLEGPVKLGSGGHASASVVRDVLIFAVSIGALARLTTRREPVRLPPLSGWVFAFVGVVVLEAFNPQTANIAKIAGGFRQQLEWVPFFFFAYALIRSKERFRKLFILIGVIALANGLVGTYQTRLSPTALASWGPGYRELLLGVNEEGGKSALGARTFGTGEGVGHVRPPALGTDAGFGGGVGGLALPALLALIATGRLRRRWPVIILALGAVLGVLTGLGRLQVIGAVLGVMGFLVLSLSAGRKFTRPLAAIAGVIALAIPLILGVVALNGGAAFSRYTSIAPENVTSSKDKKTSSIKHIPALLESKPFGVGLGTVGAAAGFGGKQTNLYEGHGVSAETEYNAIADELGFPGLLVWCALSIRLLILGLTGLRHVRDIELKIYLAAMLASFAALTIMGFGGPTMSSAAFGPFYWSFAGICAYWLAGPGRAKAEQLDADDGAGAVTP
jgi:hypothetical protein